MRNALHLIFLAAMVLFSGCKSTLRVESKRHLQPFQGGARPVYVTNPELSREYEILRASNIYPIASEPENARKLTLRPMRQYGRCANPLMLCGLTLGVVPGVITAPYVFEYTLETDGVREQRAHRLPLYERFSVWEWLVPRDDKATFSEALAWSKPDERWASAPAANMRP
jgi:hypothetical protein